MYKFYLVKKNSSKPHFILLLQFNNTQKSWILPFTKPFKLGQKRIAVESDLKSIWLKNIENLLKDRNLEFLDSGSISVEFKSQKKIVFNADGKTVFKGKFILLIPSWGLWTTKKLWVLIPV